MTIEIAATLLVLVGVVVAVVATRVAPDMILMGGLGALLIGGIVAPGDALKGFGNEGIATIAALFVVAEGMRQTGALNFVGQRLLGSPKSLVVAQLRLTAPIEALSAVMNNTPVVAIAMPVVIDWARRCQISVSKLLLPLSYASIAGGLVTLVGTSTTLVVNGMLLATPDQRGLTMFELAWIGVPTALVVLAYLPLASRWLLPDRVSAMTQMTDPREYTVEMLVESGSPVAGRTIEEAGLRRLPGAYLMEILRGDHVIAAVSPKARIEGGDRLVFVGIVGSVIDLQKIPGLTPAADQLFKIDEPRSHRCLVEAVVSTSCRFLGHTIREAKFRTHYNAVVIAVARDGERIKKKIGDIKLRAGDTLLLETHPSFVDLQRNSRDFFLVSRIEDSTPMQHERAWIARTILMGMVVLVAVEVMSMLKAAFLAGGLMIATRCLRVSQAKRSIDWGVLAGIGAGLGLGTALEKSGAAKLLAQGLVADVSDPTVVLVLLAAATMVLANLITTKAAAVLIYPIALATSQQMGVSFMPFAIAIIVSAASAYATPMGYQTNLMVFGPGGYRTSDYLRVGGPLSLIVLAMTIAIVPLVWSF